MDIRVLANDMHDNGIGSGDSSVETLGKKPSLANRRPGAYRWPS